MRIKHKQLQMYWAVTSGRAVVTYGLLYFDEPME